MCQTEKYAKWVEINLEAIKHNYRQVRQKIPSQTKILGVVKADAYGHGAPEVGRALEETGIDMLGVTTVDEGRKLREAGIAAPILVFGPFLPEDIDSIIGQDLTVTLASKEQFDWLKQVVAKLGTESQAAVRLHLKVETGFGRTGLWPSQVLDYAQAVLSTPGLLLEGVYSHLATAMWRNKGYALEQFKIFQKVLTELEQAGIKDILKHISNSAASLELPQMRLDMVRIGTLLYGQYPSPLAEGSLDLQDPWAFKARVIYLRDLPAGHSIGYGRTFKTSRPTRVAVLPIGFADGFQVEPVFKPAGLWDLIKGAVKLLLHYLNHPRVSPTVIFPEGKGRILGKAGMQLTMVDVSRMRGIELGAIVKIPIRRTAVSSAVPRVFLESEKSKAD